MFAPRALLPLCFVCLPACAASAAPLAQPVPVQGPFDRAAAEKAVAATLDDFHDAAAHADEARYFGHFAPGAVFVGTDATERWDLAAFRAYAHPHFASGKGWTYHPTRRAVAFDPAGLVAWFDEDLEGERVGPTRGSGVLVRDSAAGSWHLEQYVLSFTVPNERFAAMRAALDAPPAVDPKARRDAAYRAATEAAAAGDLARADALLSALVADAKTRPGDDAEFWLHNELTWVKWAAGDAAGARAEVEQARATLDHALLTVEQTTTLRLHERWDRAYLALDAALKAAPADRARPSARPIARARTTRPWRAPRAITTGRPSSPRTSRPAGATGSAPSPRPRRSTPTRTPICRTSTCSLSRSTQGASARARRRCARRSAAGTSTS